MKLIMIYDSQSNPLAQQQDFEMVSRRQLVQKGQILKEKILDQKWNCYAI